MRHALAPGTSDPAHFELGNCSTQRNLDDRGRAQARATGALLREAGVRFDRVLSSRWCRCLETARLMDLGAVEGAPPLDSFFEARHRRAEQTAALHAILRATPAADTLLLVTHQVNITALTGRGTSLGRDRGFPPRRGGRGHRSRPHRSAPLIRRAAAAGARGPARTTRPNH